MPKKEIYSVYLMFFITFRLNILFHFYSAKRKTFSYYLIFYSDYLKFKFFNIKCWHNVRLNTTKKALIIYE